jgi:hypothetical protein
LEPRSTLEAAERELAKVRADRDAAQAELARATEARDELARRADGLAAELETAHARADLAVGRDRNDLTYLFIVTYGRSGSTLLQGILSAAPGVVIRGENGGLLHDLLHLHETATAHRERLAVSAPLPPRHPWWGIDGYREETAFRAFRTLLLDTVLRPEPDTKVIGFKEIDWVRDGDVSRLPALLAFTRAVFPDCRFVLNTRDLDDVAASKWWARRPDARRELARMETALSRALSAYGDDVYRVHYDEHVADPSVLRGLFDWLGLDWDEDRVRAVMEVPHSY